MAHKPSLISGVVRDEKGQPVAEARVYFTDGPVPLQDVAALTNSDGEFSLVAPAPGAYSIECNTDEFRIARLQVTVEDGEESHIEIKLNK